MDPFDPEETTLGSSTAVPVVNCVIREIERNRVASRELAQGFRGAELGQSTAAVA